MHLSYMCLFLYLLAALLPLEIIHESLGVGSYSGGLLGGISSPSILEAVCVLCLILLKSTWSFPGHYFNYVGPTLPVGLGSCFIRKDVASNAQSDPYLK